MKRIEIGKGVLSPSEIKRIKAKTRAEILVYEAAQITDWQQVVLNGGPPCFHIDRGEKRFCLRAQRWHDDYAPHKFVSIANLLNKLSHL